MQRKIIILLILTSASFLKLNAQSDTSRTRSIAVFGNTSYEEPEYNGMAIKLGLLEVLGGMYGLHVEKELSSIFAVQAGTGITGRNYMMAFLYNDLEGSNDDGSNYYNHEHRTSTPGFFVSLQPKFYYQEYGFDGSYILLNFSQRRYNFSALDVDKTNSSSSDVSFVQGSKLKEHENQTVFSLGYGHQWVGDKSVLDMGVSGGIRNVNGERRSVKQTMDPFTGLHQGYTSSMVNVKRQEFYFEWFFRAGLNFKPKNS